MRNSIVGFVLPWSRVGIFEIKKSVSLNRFASKPFVASDHSFDMTDGVRFLFTVEVASRAYLAGIVI